MTKSALDSSRVEELFEEERTALKSTLYKYLRNDEDVEDVLQDAFVSVLSAVGEGTEIRHARGFLYTVARNQALDLLRSRTRKDRLFQYDRESRLDSDQVYSEIDKAKGPIDVERSFELQQTICIIVAVIEGLPPKCKLSYYLIKLEGKSYSEVSNELGMSVSCIEKYIQVANALVKEQAEVHELAMAA